MIAQKPGIAIMGLQQSSRSCTHSCLAHHCRERSGLEGAKETLYQTEKSMGNCKKPSTRDIVEGKRDFILQDVSKVSSPAGTPRRVHPAAPRCVCWDGIAWSWLVSPCCSSGLLYCWQQTQLGLAFYILSKRTLLENLSPIILSQTSSALGKTLEYQLSCLSYRWFMAQFGIFPTLYLQ